MATEYVVWGLRPGETRTYMEEPLAEKLAIEEAQEVESAAKLAGWTNVRVAKVDLRTPPNFIDTINHSLE